MAELLDSLLSEIQHHLQVEVSDLPENRISVKVTNPKIGSGGLVFRDLRIRQDDIGGNGTGSTSSKWRSILTPGSSEEANIKRGYKVQKVTLVADVDHIAILKTIGE
jgi:hypothetical protein